MSGVALAFSRAAAEEGLGRRFAPASVSASEAASAARAEGPGLPVSGLVWALMVLMIVPEGFDYAMLVTGEAPTSGGPISRILWLSLFGGGLFVVLRRAAAARTLAASLNPFLLAFIVLAMASAVWSIDSALTARRLVRVLAIVAVSLAFVLTGWHDRRFQSVVRPLLTLVLAASIVFGLAWPQWAIHQETEGVLRGAWHGLANHKNGLGNLACIGLIFWAHAVFSREVRVPIALIGGGVAVACLLLARSSTAIVTTAFTLLFMAMLMHSPAALKRYMPWLVAVFVAALLVYSLALLQVIPGLGKLLGPIGMLTGKDLTFTGRTEIWDILIADIRLHPLLGAGYGAYWAGPVMGTPSYELVRHLNFYPGSAHNGYLEVLNDLGALGLLLLLGFLAHYLLQSLRLLSIDRAQAALFLTLFLQQAITNLSESRWLSVQAVDFVIMTLAAAALARALIGRYRRSGGFTLRAGDTTPRPRLGMTGPQPAMTETRDAGR